MLHLFDKAYNSSKIDNNGIETFLKFNLVDSLSPRTSNEHIDYLEEDSIYVLLYKVGFLKFNSDI